MSALSDLLNRHIAERHGDTSNRPVYVDEAFGPVEEAVAAAISETTPPPLFDRPNA